MARLGFVNWSLLRKLAAMEHEEAWGIPIIEDDGVSHHESDIDEAEDVFIVEELAQGVEWGIPVIEDDGLSDHESEMDRLEELGEAVVDVDQGVEDNEAEAAEYVDEGVTEDDLDAPCETTVKSLEVPNGDVVSRNQRYCYTTSMILVCTEDEEDCNLCHRCYMELVRLSVVHDYKYIHYDSHTTSAGYEECSSYCSSCRLPLEQVRLTRTCIICNHAKPND